MSKRILVSTSSFLDTPGPHRDFLNKYGYEVVLLRGPLSEEKLLESMQTSGPFDGFLCGEDDFTTKVIEAAATNAKVISKYGVGLDRIDLETAQRLGIKVTNTPGVNQTSVSELAFSLMLSLARKIPEHNQHVHNIEWRRFTGVELAHKTLGIIGLGRVGKEVAKRAMAFGMRVLVFNTSWSNGHQQFVEDLTRAFSDPVFSEDKPSIAICQNAEDLVAQCDFLSLHINLTKSNNCVLDRRMLSRCKRGIYVVNVSRGGLIDQRAMADALRSGQVAGYAADVLDPEPVTKDNPLLSVYNVHLTPHIGSRTVDSVIRQGLAAAKNLVEVLEGSSASQ